MALNWSRHWLRRIEFGVDAVDGSSTRHVNAMDVGAVKAPTIWRSQVMQAITTIGLDIAKSVFQVHGVSMRRAMLSSDAS